jgi:spore germination cell wall hydrolase CwlJ-like protein
MAVGSALLAFASFAPALAEDNPDLVVPAPFTSAVAMKRQAWRFDRLKAEEAAPAVAPAQPALTNDVLAAYVERRQQLQNFDFAVEVQDASLSEDMLMGYIAKRRNQALDAIESVDVSADQPQLTAAVLTAYASDSYVPTPKKIKLADDEKLCLAQAIYHEARGESREGQLAVANVIINRAFSKKYPTTICGVVFQNADKGRYKCQFTFACDGRSDMGRERAAWNRSVKLAETAFYEFQKGETPGVIPNSVLYYHTTAVAPRWSRTFHRVAAIGSHVFYSPN